MMEEQGRRSVFTMVELVKSIYKMLSDVITGLNIPLNIGVVALGLLLGWLITREDRGFVKWLLWGFIVFLWWSAFQFWIS